MSMRQRLSKIRDSALLLRLAQSFWIRILTVLLPILVVALPLLRSGRIKDLNPFHSTDGLILDLYLTLGFIALTAAGRSAVQNRRWYIVGSRRSLKWVRRTWRTWVGWIVAVIVFGVLVAVVTGGYAAGWAWVGVAASATASQHTDPSAPTFKTLWDWLGLLIAPLALAAVGYWFTSHQSQRSERMAQVQQQEAVLQQALDRLAAFVQDHSATTSTANPALVRLQMLSALRQLDAVRKGMLMNALADAKLIWSDTDDKPVFDLTSIDLAGTTLPQHMPRIVLTGANLAGADMRNADLQGADLKGVHLEDADLSWAHLEDADLTSAHLEGADLSEAHLERATLLGVSAFGTSLFESHLEGADLAFAFLIGSDLRGAHVEAANLSSASVKHSNWFAAIYDHQTRWPSESELISAFDPVRAGAVLAHEKQAKGRRARREQQPQAEKPSAGEPSSDGQAAHSQSSGPTDAEL